MSNFSEKDKNWLEGLFDKVLNKFKSTAMNKVVQDATGTELDFTDLADDAMPAVGDMANVDGSPAEGEYVMPDGSTYVFTSGELTEIIPAEEESAEMAAMREENETLKQENENLKSAMAKLKGDVEELKNQVFSKFKVDAKKAKATTRQRQNNDEPVDRSAGLKEYLNQKKGK